jgi:hypothetical protein
MRYDIGIAALAAVILAAGLTWHRYARARGAAGARLVVVDGGLGAPVRLLTTEPSNDGIRRRPF